MLSLPPVGELRTSARRRRPRSPAPENSRRRASTSPVILIQLSRKTACICATAGLRRGNACRASARGSCASPVHSLGDADAAGEADLAVDDEELAMRAVVHARERVPAQRVIELDARARIDHRRRARPCPCCCEPTQSSSTCARTPARARSASALGEVAADLAGPVDVGLEIDRCASRERIAASIAGNISSPFFSVSTLLPGEDRRPEQHVPSVRLNCGS